jgi:hypothetical protein
MISEAYGCPVQYVPRALEGWHKFDRFRGRGPRQ